MNKPAKYTLLGIGGLVVLLVAAAAIFAAAFDVNRYKPQIEQIAKEKTGRTLKLAGPLSVAFWPSIGAKASGVTLSERGSEREFLSLDSAHVAVKLMPALRGEVIVDALHLSGLKAVVIKDKDGKHNFDDLISQDQSAKPAAKKEPASQEKTPVFDISGVTIEKSALTYRDLAKGSETAISGLKLSTGRIAPKSDGKLDLSAQVKGKNPDIDAKVELAGNYKIDLPAKAFELAKLDAKVSGSAAGFSNLKASAKGDVAANPEKSEYRIAGLAVEVKGMQGQEALEAKLSAPSLLVTKDTAKGDEVNAQFKMKGENRSTEAVVKLAGVQGSAKALVVPKLTAEVSLASPDMPMKSVKLPVSGSLRADLEKQTASADLVSKFDESNIQAKLGLARFTPPSYLFDINVDRLNLDKYFPPKDEPKGGAGTGSSKPAGGQKPADSPIDLSALKDLNANGKIQVGALQTNNVKLANLRADIKAANGRLDVAPHSANLYDGSMSGALSATADNRIAIRETLTNVSIGPLLRDAAKQDRLEGRGNVTLDVTTAGKTVEGMKKGLNGTAKVVLRDGAIKGIDIAAALRKAKSVLPGGQTPAQAASTQEKTDFSELVATFVIKNGVAHNEDLDVKAPIFRLTGRGDIDIGESKLDYQARAAVVNTTKGQGGADLAELSGLTVPVHLSGPFADLKYKVDYGAVAADLAKSRVGNRLKEQLGERLGIGGAKPPAQGDAGKAPAQGGGGSVGDKLRGLLGR
ncbi:MAG: AsmA family protein [Betaproteobacteria bacterium]